MTSSSTLNRVGVLISIGLSSAAFVMALNTNETSPTPSTTCSPTSASPGPIGSPGPSGSPGAKGTTGKTGKTGTSGSTGASGVCGIGDIGPAGQSAYQLWLALGNFGIETDFINSLKGATGNTGAKGQDGAFTAIANQDPPTYTGSPFWLVDSSTLGFSQNNFSHIANLDYAQFDTTATGVTPGVGKMWWDANDGTINLGLKGEM